MASDRGCESCPWSQFGVASGFRSDIPQDLEESQKLTVAESSDGGQASHMAVRLCRSVRTQTTSRCMVCVFHALLTKDGTKRSCLIMCLRNDS